MSRIKYWYTQSIFVTVKVNVNLSLRLTKRHAVQTYWREWRYSSTHSWPRH